MDNIELNVNGQDVNAVIDNEQLINDSNDYEFDNNLSHSEEENEEQPIRKIYALSTIDNPFNPFDDFTNWHLYDIEHEYFCCEYLARIINETDEMSELEKIKETERAIDEIITINPNPIYIKVSKEITL